MDFQEQEFQKESELLGLTAVYAHGSQVSGGAREDSDLDLAILVPREWSWQEFAAQADKFALVVAEAKHFPLESIHFQDLRECPPYFGFRVLNTGVLLGVNDPTALAEFQAQTFCRTWDEEFFMRPILRSFSERVKKSGYAS